jgi:hypothetical protein
VGAALGAALAYLVYPGLATVFALGLLGEWANGRALPVVRPLLRRPPLLVVLAALLSALAAAQLGAPFNPLASGDRNLLVAAVAVGAGAALGLDAGWARRTPVLMPALAGWTASLLVPAVLAQDLHPGVLASLALGPALPLKVASALLYLLAGGALLEAAGQEVRQWLWLPVAGLFASVFVPAPGDDAAGLFAFFAATLGALAVMLALGLAARRLPQLSDA